MRTPEGLAPRLWPQLDGKGPAPVRGHHLRPWQTLHDRYAEHEFFGRPPTAEGVEVVEQLGDMKTAPEIGRSPVLDVKRAKQRGLYNDGGG